MSTNTNYAALYYRDLSKEPEVLEKNVRDHPASSVAHFMRLYHLKTSGNPQFEEVAKQTAPYLYNTLWTSYQLSQAGQSDRIEAVLPPEESTGDVAQTDDTAGAQETLLPLPEVAAETEASAGAPAAGSTQDGLQLSPQEAVAEGDNGMALEEAAGDATREQASELAPMEPGDEAITAGDTPASAALQNGSDNEIDETKEGNQAPSTVPEEAGKGDVVASDAAAAGETWVDKTNENAQINNGFVEVPQVEERVSIDPQAGVDATAPGANEETSARLPQAETGPSAPEDEEALSVDFEPLHTVDYFASQGIRLSEESLQNDTLGRQVKSFTAWLKSMKKLHPGQLPEQNEVIEKLIQTSSEASNQNADILTEAMAEVLVKQGKRQKAIAMYEKLSLLNPSKSAYFAAKIESIKIV